MAEKKRRLLLTREAETHERANRLRLSRGMAPVPSSLAAPTPTPAEQAVAQLQALHAATAAQNRAINAPPAQPSPEQLLEQGIRQALAMRGNPHQPSEWVGARVPGQQPASVDASGIDAAAAKHYARVSPEGIRGESFRQHISGPAFNRSSSDPAPVDEAAKSAALANAYAKKSELEASTMPQEFRPQGSAKVRLKVSPINQDKHIEYVKARMAAKAAGATDKELPPMIAIGLSGSSERDGREQKAIQGAANSKKIRLTLQQPQRQAVMEKAQRREGIPLAGNTGSLDPLTLIRMGAPASVVQQAMVNQNSDADRKSRLAVEAEVRRHESDEKLKDRTAERKKTRLTIKGQRGIEKDRQQADVELEKFRQQLAEQQRQFNQQFTAQQNERKIAAETGNTQAELANRLQLGEMEGKNALEAARLQAGIGVPVAPDVQAKAAMDMAGASKQKLIEAVNAVESIKDPAQALEALTRMGVTPAQLRELYNWSPYWDSAIGTVLFESMEEKRIREAAQQRAGAFTGSLPTPLSGALHGAL